jgi:hypothetical protein
MHLKYKTKCQKLLFRYIVLSSSILWLHASDEFRNQGFQNQDTIVRQQDRKLFKGHLNTEIPGPISLQEIQEEEGSDQWKQEALSAQAPERKNHFLYPQHNESLRNIPIQTQHQPFALERRSSLPHLKASSHKFHPTGLPKNEHLFRPQTEAIQPHDLQIVVEPSHYPNHPPQNSNNVSNLGEIKLDLNPTLEDEVNHTHLNRLNPHHDANHLNLPNRIKQPASQSFFNALDRLGQLRELTSKKKPGELSSAEIDQINSVLNNMNIDRIKNLVTLSGWWRKTAHATELLSQILLIVSPCLSFVAGANECSDDSGDSHLSTISGVFGVLSLGLQKFSRYALHQGIRIHEDINRILESFQIKTRIPVGGQPSQDAN